MSVVKLYSKRRQTKGKGVQHNPPASLSSLLGFLSRVCSLLELSVKRGQLMVSAHVGRSALCYILIYLRCGNGTTG